MQLFFLVLLIFFESLALANEFNSYVEKASDRKSGMNIRWNSLLRAAEIASETASEDQIRQIIKFVNSNEWYMRNAALISLVKINPQRALTQAKKLLNDKALVVRSAAVEVVAQNLTPEHKKVLASELHKSYNFNKKSSLWIRKQIIEKLSLAAGIQDRDIFIKNLFDTDNDVSQISAKTLEKITGQVVNEVKYVEKWRAIVKQNNWL